ncbi:hypothetical protein ACHAXS_012970 [Conticribra weissflogii]
MHLNIMLTVYIGIDVGTQGVKAIAYQPSSRTTEGVSNNSNTSGLILARASKGYDVLPTNVDGRVEQDPADWVDAVRYVLKEIVHELSLAPPSDDISSEKYILSGIGISGQQHGMVLLDSNFKPLRPAKLWCDVEASEESQWIRSITDDSKVDPEAQQWSHVLPGFTSPKVLWTIRNEPDIWNRVRWCVLPHDFINLVLRGAHDDCPPPNITPTTDRGDASGSGIFDTKKGQYNEQLINRIDPSGRYEKSIPQILNPLDICGYLSFQWMHEIGLLTEEETDGRLIPISVGSGDNMCSALGVGCVQPGMAVMSLGTSGTIFGVSHSPPSSEVAPFADATGKYLPLVCIMSCTAVLNSVLESFFNGNEIVKVCEDSEAKKWTHHDATELAKCYPPGCHGINFLPYLTPGERTPDWPHATGAILGLTASNLALAKASATASTDSTAKIPIDPMAGILYRAAMEGITYQLAEGLATMQRACKDGFKPSSLLVVGGGSHNKLWRQMLADVLQLELRFPREKESAALGAAFQAGAAVEASKQKDGSSGFSMDMYVLKQNIDIQEDVVRPTTDARVLKLYRDGRERHCRYSQILFVNSSK